MVFLEIRLQAAHCHRNVAIHFVNVTNRDNIVPKAVQLILNVHAVSCVRPVNVEIDAILVTA